jgi:DNA-binding NtrC family response regulator
MSEDTASILLVDDESTVRNLLRSALEQKGYSVTCAGNLSEAVQYCSQLPSIGLLIADLSLPDGNGCELAEFLLGAEPEMRVIFISAPAGSNVMRYYDAPGDRVRFLEKPFAPEALLHLIADSFEGRKLDLQKAEAVSKLR